jgi:hypothetical protein
MNAWRRRQLRCLDILVDEHPGAQEHICRRHGYRKSILTPEGHNLRHEKPRQVIEAIMCGIVPECGHPNWNCVLRRCSFCLAYQTHALEEEELSIRFHHYVNVTRCSIQHGVLERQAKTCLECEQAVEGTKKERLGLESISRY